MKDKKLIIMISSILGVMLLLFMVFEVATMFNSTLTESSNRSLEISIALFAMFTTFGGAYLGAKISGENAFKVEKERQRQDKFDKVYQFKSLLKMNSFHLYDFHLKLCESYKIDKEIFLSDLQKFRSEIYDGYIPKNLYSNDNIKFFDNHSDNMSKEKKKVYFNKHDLKNIEYFLEIINEVNIGIYYFDFEFQEVVFGLKQVLSKIYYKVEYSDQYDLYYIDLYDSMERLIFKADFMWLSLLHIDFSKDIT